MTAEAVADAAVRSENDDIVDSGARAAAITFGALLFVAFWYYLHLGRGYWFFSDEWDQLANRSATDLGSLLAPHNDHLQLIPTLVYRTLYSTVGLESYLPYQLPVLILFLTSAAMLRVVIRRAGGGPWIATLVAASYLLLGSCLENILFGIQISMMGSVATGLVGLVLLDRETSRSFVRRDGWAVGLLVLSLMCSGVGVTMTAVAVLSSLLRRGWRVAATVVAVPGMLFLVWSAFYGTSRLRPGSVGDLANFVRNGVEATLMGIGQHPVVAWGIVAVLFLGVAVLVERERRTAVTSMWDAVVSLVSGRLALPAAMLVGAVAIIAYAGLGRAGPFGAESARSPRYFALSITLMLPAVAVAADALARRSRVAGIVAILIVAAGIPPNVAIGIDQAREREVLIGQAQDMIVAVSIMPGSEHAPDDMRPLPESVLAPHLDMGFIREIDEEGWLPDPDEIDPHLAARATHRLALYQTYSDEPGEASVEPEVCDSLGAPGSPGSIVRVEQGDRLVLGGGFVQVDLTDGAGRIVEPLVRVTFNPNRGDVIEVLSGPMELRLTSGGINGEGQLCAIS